MTGAYLLLAEAYRSRTYLRGLARTPVLKTGRHTGDETLPICGEIADISVAGF